MWTHYLIDNLQTGLLGAQIDIPGFSWGRTVSDSSMQTEKDKGTGTDSMTSISIPWASIPAETPEDRDTLLMPNLRGICSMWDGVPITFGIISEREDTQVDTSLTADGITTVLAKRLATHEGIIGVRPDTVSFNGLSLGTIAARLVQLAMQKPGGVLPIDFQPEYTDTDDADHQRSYNSWDTQNIVVADLLTKLSNVISGPDIGFRPYLADSQHVRLRMVAGTPGSPFIGQDTVHAFSYFPGGAGGSVQNLHRKLSGQYQSMRVVATGAGQDEATLVEQAQNLDPTKAGFVFLETVKSDTSTETVELLRSHAQATVNVSAWPLAQLTGEIRADGPVMLGQVWPGDETILQINDFPTLPDGDYRVRLLELSGNQTETIQATWDVMEAGH